MRSQVVSDWVASTDWAQWRRISLTGDASARRYERLIGPNGQSAILMDADPTTCGSQSRFVEIAAHIRSLDLCAPAVLAFDDALGLLVLSDLGAVDYAQHLAGTLSDETALYQAAVDVLLRLQSAPPPSGLITMTPDVGTDMIDLAFEWAATDPSLDLRLEISAEMHRLLSQTATKAPVLSLRDFHAENLIWREGHTGTSRVGLLDFQDAFVAHPMYDLASLLRDARRDVDAEMLAPLIAQLCDGQDMAGAKSAFHIIAVQRNLRILGIFNRLARRDGKDSYLSLIPRVWAHLQTDLNTPELTHLSSLIARAFATKDI